LPNLLCSSPKLPRTAPIGFFIHVASSRIFRCLSVAEDLLLGLLGVDLVTANYARHFRRTVSRTLMYEALLKGIQVPEEHSAQAEGGCLVRDELG
ncbi:glycosyltransferase family 20 protein, partial [Laccaria amethystina LaAM-08-1]